MNRWFTKLAMVLLPSFVVSFAPMNAAYNSCDPCYVDSSCGPCDPCTDWCSGFDFGADFIFWKPCIDDLNYAVLFNEDVSGGVSGTSAVGSYKYIEPNWQPGFRVYLGKEDIWGGWDLMASYTWNKVNKYNRTATATAGTLQTTIYNPGVVPADGYDDLSAKYKFQYQTFDVLAGTDCSICNGHVFKPFFGLTGVFLDQKINFRGMTDAGAVGAVLDTASWNSDYWGIGLRVGSQYRYTICDGFDFFASFSGAIVAGENNTKRIDNGGGSEPVQLTLKNDNHGHFMNGYHIQSGFEYDDCWCSWDYQFRLGYEFVKWYNVSTVRRFVNTASTQQIGTTASPTTSTVGFHGLFAGFGVSF